MTISLSRASMTSNPRPWRSLAPDIGERIISTRLPEDKDDRRNLTEDGYELRSDVESCEHLTGGVVQPEAHYYMACDEGERLALISPPGPIMSVDWGGR